MNMLVGLGEDNGMYSQKETIRLGIPFIIVIYVMTVLIEVPYWSMLGLLINNLLKEGWRCVDRWYFRSQRGHFGL